MSLFIWPTAIHTLGDGFGARNGEHQGIDIEVPNGTPVIASMAGKVVTAGLSGSYGNLVSIDTAFPPSNDVSMRLPTYETRYGHLSHIQVSNGELVAQGQQIGLSGGIKGAYGSGDATGPHLHFEIRENGKAVNPIPLLGAGTGNGIAPQAPSASWTDQIGSVLGFISKPASWVRIGLFALGTLLLIIALSKLFASTDTGQTIINTTKKVATTAAETAALA